MASQQSSNCYHAHIIMKKPQSMNRESMHEQIVTLTVNFVNNSFLYISVIHNMFGWCFLTLLFKNKFMTKVTIKTSYTLTSHGRHM